MVHLISHGASINMGHSRPGVNELASLLALGGGGGWSITEKFFS